MCLGLSAIPLILLPFAFWYAVWNGNAVTPDEVQAAFSEPLKPSAAGGVLLRIAERMSRGDKELASHWYPKMLELSRHESRDLRRTVAWVIGKDATEPRFRARLKELLSDSDASVRRSAAISLAGLGDISARDTLVASIAPQQIRSTAAGSISFRIQPADTAGADTTIAIVGETLVESGVAGTVMRHVVKDGEMVSRGQVVLEILPPEDELADSLRALALVGNASDVAAVQKCANDVSGEKKAIIQNEAERTIRTLTTRTASLGR